MLLFSGIINPLFDGLTYNTSGRFAHCSQNIRAYYMLSRRIRCIYYKNTSYICIVNSLARIIAL